MHASILLQSKMRWVESAKTKAEWYQRMHSINAFMFEDLLLRDSAWLKPNSNQSKKILDRWGQVQAHVPGPTMTPQWTYTDPLRVAGTGQKATSQNSGLTAQLKLPWIFPPDLHAFFQKNAHPATWHSFFESLGLHHVTIWKHTCTLTVQDHPWLMNELVIILLNGNSVKLPLECIKMAQTYCEDTLHTSWFALEQVNDLKPITAEWLKQLNETTSISLPFNLQDTNHVR